MWPAPPILTSGYGSRPKNADFPLPKVLLPCHHDGDSNAVAVRQMTAFSARARIMCRVILHLLRAAQGQFSTTANCRLSGCSGTHIRLTRCCEPPPADLTCCRWSKDTQHRTLSECGTGSPAAKWVMAACRINLRFGWRSVIARRPSVARSSPWQVSQGPEAGAAGQCALDRCLDDIRLEKCERQDHATGSLASIFARRDRSEVGDVPLNQLIEPNSSDRSCGRKVRPLLA